MDMARPPRRPTSRDGAGGEDQAPGSGQGLGRGRLARPSAARSRLATRGPDADQHRATVDGDLDRCSDDDLEVENDDDLGEDVGDDQPTPGTAGSQPQPIEIDDEGEVDGSTDTHGTSTIGGKRSDVWDYFDEIKENKIRVAAICKHCRSRYSGRSAGGTGHLRRHMKSCSEKRIHATMVQSKLALNANGLRNWVYDPAVARIELCRLIARLDLPLGIGETQAWEDYIKRAHNPVFEKVSRQTTTRDMWKLFAEERDLLMKSLLPAASSVCLTSDIWSGNAKEDYISVVAHYVTADWELEKKVVGFRLVNCKHTGENIADSIASVVEEFGLVDKVFAITLDNASSNSKAYDILQAVFCGYLGSYPAPTRDDPNLVKYMLVHQRCACHIINLIVKSGLKRVKPYTEDFRTAINFLNSSNQRIALFKNFCTARGIRPRKFGLDMDVRWNSTYLMLKHLLPYKEVFSVFINSNYGSELLTANHWYVAEHIMVFLKMFYNCTVVLSGVYYPTAPLVLHHILDIAEHLDKAEQDANFRSIAKPMKQKMLKYWENIPFLYSYAFILDPRAKMKGFYNMLDLLGKAVGCDYNLYYGDVKERLIRLFYKYDDKFGNAARRQRAVQPSSHSGRTTHVWGRIFGGPGASPSSSSTPSPSAVSELTAYMDSDPVAYHEEGFDILLWWKDHKLTYPILSILARDIMAVPVSTVSSESCFSLTGRILEDRRRRLKPEHVEMLTCIKDWDQGSRREQHAVEDTDLEESFQNLYLDEEGEEGSRSGQGSGAGPSSTR